MKIKKITLLTILTIIICASGALLGLCGMFNDIRPLMILGVVMLLGMIFIYHIVKAILTKEN